MRRNSRQAAARRLLGVVPVVYAGSKRSSRSSCGGAPVASPTSRWLRAGRHQHAHEIRDTSPPYPSMSAHYWPITILNAPRGPPVVTPLGLSWRMPCLPPRAAPLRILFISPARSMARTSGRTPRGHLLRAAGPRVGRLRLRQLRLLARPICSRSATPARRNSSAPDVRGACAVRQFTHWLPLFRPSFRWKGRRWSLTFPGDDINRNPRYAGLSAPALASPPSSSLALAATSLVA